MKWQVVVKWRGWKRGNYGMAAAGMELDPDARMQPHMDLKTAVPGAPFGE